MKVLALAIISGCYSFDPNLVGRGQTANRILLSSPHTAVMDKKWCADYRNHSHVEINLQRNLGEIVLV